MEREKIIKIACVYAGTILGAGFASGQELLRFFIKYGFNGIFGLIVSGILFSLIGWAVLMEVYNNNIKNYSEFACHIMGRKFGFVMEIIVVIFLMILFSTMLAAGGASINKVFGINSFIGTIIITSLCFITFLFDVNGIVEINIILCPILVIGGIFIGIYVFLNQYSSVFKYDVSVLKLINENWIVSAIVYVSYNIITAVSVLVSLNKIVVSKKIARWGGCIGGTCMGILGLCMSLPLFSNYISLKNTEIPMLDIVDKYGNLLKYIYLIILLSAVFTTAVGNGFAVIQWLGERLKIKSFYIKFFVCIIAMIISRAGFSNFVGKVYPMFGYIGLIEMSLIVIVFFKNIFLNKLSKKRC